MTKRIRIAIVDESARARGFITDALESAGNVEIAASVTSADQLAQYTVPILPDIIFMDISTPAGLEALPGLVKSMPGVKIIALAGNSEAGIQAMVKGMQRGAADCLIKILPTENAAKAKRFVQDIKTKVDGFAADAGLIAPPQDANAGAAAKAVEIALTFQPKPSVFMPKALAIACSTGGPKSLVSVFQKLKGKKFSVPVFVTQHMPKDFTKHFAKQLEEAIGLPAAEGVDGETVLPGHIYVAPGDYHMQVEKNAAGKIIIRLNQNAPENFCRPAADPMIRSLVDVYGGGILLAVLTGMGSDALKGAEILVKEGGLVIAQDKASSVVWGMPGAVAMAGLTHKLYPLDEIHLGIIDYSSGRIA